VSHVRYRKPSILASIPKDRHTVIEASAGTGKTFTLEHLVVELILSGVEISQILVVTFTRPATSELVARIRQLLVKLLDLDEDEGGDAPDEDCWILDQQARARIELALRKFDTATISTIHSFCQGILREHAFANQRLFSEEMVDRDEAFHRAFQEVIREQIAVHPRWSLLLGRWLQEKDLDALEDLLARCAAVRGPVLPRWIDPGPADGGEGERMLAAIGSSTTLEALVVQEFLPPIQERLVARKREAGLIDYEDMLSLLRDSLRGAHGPALVSILRERFRYALIDEFQDTDELQWDVFRTIFFESDRRDPEGRKLNLLYLIGDPKQAIYRFRGADVETYLRARETLLAAGGARVALRQNFRSTGALIAGYNEILAQGGEQPFFTHPKIVYDEPVACGNEILELLDGAGGEAPPIHVFEIQTPRGKTLKSGKPGAPLRNAGLILPPLGRAIAAHIRAITDPAAPSLRLRDKRGEAPIALREIFILCSSNSESKQIGAVLREEGIPFAFFKQDGLFETQEAAALLDVLQAIADPGDDSKRMKAWLTPFFGLRLDALPAARALPPSHPLHQRLYEWKAEAEGRSFGKLFSRLFDESGIVRRLILSQKGERELTNYLHIAERLLEVQSQGRRSLPELISLLSRWIEGSLRVEGEEGNQQRLESDRDAVQIMTMHASKGLEAKVVFLVGGLHKNHSVKTRSFHPDKAFLDSFLETTEVEAGERVTFVWRAASGLPKEAKGLKALTGAVDELASLEERYEAERLLYVALTRAKGRLYLPFYTGGSDPKPLTGSYAVLDDRLRHLLEQPGFSRRVTREVIDCSAAPPAPAATGVVGSNLAAWEPRSEAFEVPDRSAELARLRELHRGYRITSYTQMKSGGAPTPSHDPDREDFLGDGGAAPHVSVEDLPGGAGVGIFLHEVLALLPARLALDAQSVEDFASRPEVDLLLRTEGARAGLEPRYLGEAAKLIFTSLRARLRLRDGRALEGIASAEPLLREMEFLYPIPERSHPRLTEALDGSALEIRRGFVKGFVDLLFEHDGLAYFGDWKSDVLPSYSQSEIALRVEQSYRLQSKLYCLAMVKMLELRDEASYEARFGGFVYLFLRGMELEGDGTRAIHFERPSWREVLGWEAELLERDDLEGAA